MGAFHGILWPVNVEYDDALLLSWICPILGPNFRETGWLGQNV